MDRAHNDIDYSRTHSYPEWLIKTGNATNETLERILEERGWLRKYYDDERNGIVLTQCNSRTLYKLEQLKLIDIISISTGSSYGIDKVQVLNY